MVLCVLTGWLDRRVHLLGSTPQPDDASPDGAIRCRPRVGGLLHFYYRAT
jgi:hypothetical protein